MSSIFSTIREKLGLGGDLQNVESIEGMPQFIPTPPTESPQYSDEHVRMLENRLKVESKEDMILFIDNSDLSSDCQECFKNIVINMYDRNVIMANNNRPNGIEIAYIEAQLRIFPNVLAASTKNDRTKPAFLEIYNMILFQLQTRISRTDTLDREGILSTKQTVSYEMAMRKQQGDKK